MTRLPPEKRSKVREQVAHAVDAWFDAAYVERLPAQRLRGRLARLHHRCPGRGAGRQGLMSNQDIGADIAGVEATARKVTVDVLLAVKGKPSGRPRIRAEVPTDGDVQRKVEVRRRLFLAPEADAGTSSATT